MAAAVGGRRSHCLGSRLALVRDGDVGDGGHRWVGATGLGRIADSIHSIQLHHWTDLNEYMLIHASHVVFGQVEGVFHRSKVV